jgi:hypothetical protein
VCLEERWYWNDFYSKATLTTSAWIEDLPLEFVYQHSVVIW